MSNDGDVTVTMMTVKATVVMIAQEFHEIMSVKFLMNRISLYFLLLSN